MKSYAAVCAVLLALLSGHAALAQPAGTGGSTSPPDAPALFEDLARLQDRLAADGWLLHGQSTFIEQGHPSFPAPYRGENSLQNRAMQRNTLSADIVVGRALWQGAEFIVNPQVSRGFGLSGTRGIAAFPNGEAFRTGSEAPIIYVTRLLLRQTIGLSEATVMVDDDPLRLPRALARERITITAGKMAIFDIFDDNRYAHDPRTQFLNWAFVSAGAFDFANDAKGYTNGIAIEWENGAWAVRGGAFQVAKRLNSLSLDPKPLRGFQVLLEADRFWNWRGRSGALRLIGGVSRTRSQSYQALIDGDIAETQINLAGGTATKPMMILNGEQEFSDELGGFFRLSWNDGRTQQWMYTEMDRAASAGLVLRGRRWGRPQDRVAAAVNIGGLSGVHRRFLEAGGIGFITGDGRLNYRPEWVIETYYDWQVAPGINATADAQYIGNPAYNSDRGPVAVFAVRLRAAF